MVQFNDDDGTYRKNKKRRSAILVAVISLFFLGFSQIFLILYSHCFINEETRVADNFEVNLSCSKNNCTSMSLATTKGRVFAAYIDDENIAYLYMGFSGKASKVFQFDTELGSSLKESSWQSLFDARALQDGGSVLSSWCGNKYFGFDRLIPAIISRKTGYTILDPFHHESGGIYINRSQLVVRGITKKIYEQAGQTYDSRSSIAFAQDGEDVLLAHYIRDPGVVGASINRVKVIRIDSIGEISTESEPNHVCMKVADIVLRGVCPVNFIQIDNTSIIACPQNNKNYVHWNIRKIDGTHEVGILPITSKEIENNLLGFGGSIWSTNRTYLDGISIDDGKIIQREIVPSTSDVVASTLVPVDQNKARLFLVKKSVDRTKLAIEVWTSLLYSDGSTCLNLEKILSFEKNAGFFGRLRTKDLDIQAMNIVAVNKEKNTSAFFVIGNLLWWIKLGELSENICSQ